MQKQYKKIENSKIELNEFLEKRVDDLKKNFEEFKKLAKEDKRDISKEEQFIKDCVDDYFKKKHNTIIAKENENWGQDDSFETFSVHEEDQSKAEEPTPFQFVCKKSTSTPQLNTETLPDDLQYLIVGDSIVQGIKNQQFHKGQNTKVISLRGRGLQEVRKYFQSVLLEGSQPKNIVIHVGSNDVLNDTAENFIKVYETLIEEIKIKFQDSKLFVSLIIQKVNNEHFNKKSAYFNKLLKEMSTKMNISFIPHYIIEENLFRSDGTHLSERGTATFVSNMKLKLRGSRVGKSTQFNNQDTDKIGPTNENFKSLLLGLIKML